MQRGVSNTSPVASNVDPDESHDQHPAEHARDTWTGVRGEGAALSPPSSERSAASNPLLRRRNGKLQSCEPCRRSKVSCDHSHPKCARCVRRGIQECVYHPAPLTKANSTTSRVVKQQPSPTPSNASTSAPSNLLLMFARHQATNKEDPAQTDEYHGPTNYRSFFKETQRAFGGELWRNTATGTELYPKRITDHLGPIRCTSSSVAIGAEVLSWFPPEDLSARLLEGFFETCFLSLPVDTMRFALKEFWSQWREDIANKNFEKIAKKLLSVQPKPLRSVQRADEWLKSFTGDGAGFEMIGIFFSFFGLGAWVLPPWDPLFDLKKHGQVAKKRYLEVYGEAADVCLDLCAGVSTASEPLIWLMHHAQVCQSQYRGDDDVFQWQKLGLMSTAVISFGLHREITTTNVPFIVAESRIRTFASIYVSDKHLSTYTGRPPRLSKRFCVCKLPLELTDLELLAEEQDLPSIVGQLNKDGWNMDATWRPVCILRLLMVAAKVRDEVLELCLGPSTEVSLARKRELKQKNDDAYNSVPSRFHWVRDETEILLADGRLLMARLVFSMETTLNTFLIERLPSPEDGEADQANLIKVSLSMLEHLGYFLKYRQKLSFYTTLAWELVYFAIPCASVLLLELLKQHQYPRKYKQQLPRSEIIQNLSVYLLCLTSVGPEEGNYQVCQRMNKVVKRVLDEILEPRTEPEPVESNGGDVSQLIPEVDISAVLDPNDDADFMRWMQSIDWTKAPWTDTLGGL